MELNIIYIFSVCMYVCIYIYVYKCMCVYVYELKKDFTKYLRVQPSLLREKGYFKGLAACLCVCVCMYVCMHVCAYA